MHLKSAIVGIIAACWMPVAAIAFEPTVALSVENPANPIFHGTTNLPSGSKLMITVTRIGGGVVGQDTMDVFASHFTTQRFAYGGHPLPPGQYEVEISMSMAELQPKNVQAVLGEHGDRLTGRYLDRLMGETMFDYVERRQLGASH